MSKGVPGQSQRATFGVMSRGPAADGVATKAVSGLPRLLPDSGVLALAGGEIGVANAATRGTADGDKIWHAADEVGDSLRWGKRIERDDATA